MVGCRWVKTPLVDQDDPGRVHRPPSLVCALPVVGGPDADFYRFLFFKHLAFRRRTAYPLARPAREGVTTRGGHLLSPEMSAASYISIASAISTEPPRSSSGQPFALAAASS
jgi:hypothetical protein